MRRNSLGLLGIAVPILNHDTFPLFLEFLHLSPSWGFMLMLIKAAGRSRSFSFIFSQRYYSHQMLALPFGTLQDLKSARKQAVWARNSPGVTCSGQILVAYCNQGKNKWCKLHFLWGAAGFGSFSPCTRSSVCRDTEEVWLELLPVLLRAQNAEWTPLFHFELVVMSHQRAEMTGQNLQVCLHFAAPDVQKTAEFPPATNAIIPDPLNTWIPKKYRDPGEKNQQGLPLKQEDSPTSWFHWGATHII